MKLFDVHPQTVSILGGFVAILTVELGQYHVLGLDVSRHVQPVQAGVTADVADKSSAFGVTGRVLFDKGLQLFIGNNHWA